MEEPTQPAKKRKVEPAERKHSIDYTRGDADTHSSSRCAQQSARRSGCDECSAQSGVAGDNGRGERSVTHRRSRTYLRAAALQERLQGVQAVQERAAPSAHCRWPALGEEAVLRHVRGGCPGDSRIEGVGGVDLGTQSPAEMAEAVKSIATQQSQPVFPELESQQLSEKSAWDISGVYDDDADTVSTAGTVHGSSSTVFRTPTVIKPRRKSSAVVDSNVLAKDSMKLEVVEMQRKLLMQQQSNAMFERQALEQWSEGIGEWRENLRKYSALLDVQLHRARRNQTPDTEDLAALNLLSAELPPSSIRVDDDDSVLADHNRRSSPF